MSPRSFAEVTSRLLRRYSICPSFILARPLVVSCWLTSSLAEIRGYLSLPPFRPQAYQSGWTELTLLEAPTNGRRDTATRNLKLTRHRDECQKWSTEMIMSKSKPFTLGAAIFYGGLIAGILDAADGVVAYYFAAGFNPIQVLQFIASGFYGATAFQKGIPGALVGLLAHFSIAFAVAAIYVAATRFLPILNREPVMQVTIYAPSLFIF